jgi:hypothetical protein
MVDKYRRILTIENVSVKKTGDDPSGFVALFDKSVPHIQGIGVKIFWRLNVDDIDFAKGRRPQWDVRFGPNPWFEPPVNFRGGFLQKTEAGLEYEDETEILVLSEDLCQQLIQWKKEQRRW